MAFKFDRFEIDNVNLTLKKDGELIEIEPKIFQLLCYFCQKPNTPISREELIEHVWEGRTVSDAAINRAISELRKAFGAENKNIIQTVSKVGYKFVAELDVSETPSIKSKNDHHPVYSNRTPYKFWAFSTLFLVAAIIIFISLFESDKNSTVQLTEHAPVTSDIGSEFKPRVAKENTTLVYLAKANAESFPQVWLQQTDDQTIQVTFDKHYYLSAIQIAPKKVVASRFNNLDDRDCEIVLININNNQTTKLHDCAKRANTHLVFNSKENKILFNYRKDLQSPFYVASLHLDTKRLQQITIPNPNGNMKGDHLFELSPSEELLATLEYMSDGKSQLKLVNTTATPSIKTFSKFSNASGLTWVNEKELIITSGLGLERVNIETWESNVILERDNLAQATYQQKNKKLYYVRGQYEGNIYQVSLVEPSDEAPTKLTHSSFSNQLPIYANTNNDFIFVSTIAGKFNLQLSTQKSALQFPEPINNIGTLKWSPDDSFIVATINSKLFLFDLQSKIWKALPLSVQNIHHVSVVNNNQVVVSSDHSGDWQLWLVDLTTFASEQLTRTGGYSSQIGPNSTYIYYTKFAHDGLYKAKISDWQEEQVSTRVKVKDWNSWTIKQSTLYFIEGQDLIKQNLNNHSITSLPLPNLMNYITINHNGSLGAFSKIDHANFGIWQATLSKEYDQQSP